MKFVERSFQLSAPGETVGISDVNGPTITDYLAMARLKPGEKPAYAAILGVIPAEESDEEFAAAVADLS